MAGLRAACLTTAALMLLAGAQAQFLQVAPGGASFQTDSCSDFAISAYNSWQVIEAGADRCCGGVEGLAQQFDAAVAANLNTVRFFGFATQEGEQLQLAESVYDRGLLVGMDQAIALAGQRGLKLIIALANNWDYTGNSTDTKAFYTNQSSTATNPDDFWTDEQAIAHYLRAAQLLTRRPNTITGVMYNEDPTIIAWNLINEPRCESDSCTPADIQSWIARVAPEVKSYVTNQLVTVGEEGFWQADNCAADTTNPVKNSLGWPLRTGQDFLPNHAVDGIDFASVHLLPINWGRTDNSFGTAWLNGHSKQAGLISKPLLVEQFAISVDPSSDIVLQNATDYYKLAYAITEASIASGGALRGIGFSLWDAVEISQDAPGVDQFSLVASTDPAFMDTIVPFSGRIAERCPITPSATAPSAAVSATAPSAGPSVAAFARRHLLQAVAPAPGVDAAAINAEVPADMCFADTTIHGAPSVAPSVSEGLGPVAEAPVTV